MSDASDRRSFSGSMAALAITLTALAGYVDAIGYLSLGHVYVANMSGNSIAIGLHLSRAEKLQIWRFGWPVFSFTVGLLLSRILIAWGIQKRWRSVAASALAVEIIALAGFVAVPSGAAGVFLAASAMGIQAATVSQFNGVTVYTCFVTGSLVKFAEHAAGCLVRFAGPGRAKRSEVRKAAWFAGIWTAYVVGAVLGATALERVAHASVLVAIACLAVLAVMDLISPASLEGTVQ